MCALNIVVIQNNYEELDIDQLKYIPCIHMP